MSRTKLRIFIGLHEIAGYYTNLTDGLRQLGHTADFYSFDSHPFAYKVAPNKSLLLQLIIFLRKINRSVQGRWHARIDALIQVLIKRLFFICIEQYDIFVLGFNSRFTSYIDTGHPRHKEFNDLQILKNKGKKILQIYHGSDSRPPYMDGAIMAPSTGRSIDDCATLTLQKKKFLELADTFADWIIDSPASGQFHCKPFINWFYIGVPYGNQMKTVDVLPVQQSGAVRILHSPSFPEAKGSVEIRTAIDRLIEEGYDIDYVCITGLANQRVLEEIVKSDIVVDQLYSDTPMAGFATEAAFLGKPVIVGGYFKEHIRDWIPNELLPPTVFISPEEIFEAIKHLLVDREKRVQIGAELRRFVLEKWSVSAVAKKFESIFLDQIPHEWVVDPSLLNYLEGGAISSTKRRELFSALYRKYGISIFQLQDKSILTNRLKQELNLFAKKV